MIRRVRQPDRFPAPAIGIARGATWLIVTKMKRAESRINDFRPGVAHPSAYHFDRLLCTICACFRCSRRVGSVSSANFLMFWSVPIFASCSNSLMAAS